MRSSLDGPELQRIYSARFAGKTEYRTQVWRVLAPFFGQWFPNTGTVLDLGAGYCEFINNAAAGVKYAMDLNPIVHMQAAGTSPFSSKTVQRLGHFRKGNWTPSSRAIFWSTCPTKVPSSSYCQMRTDP